MHASRQGWNMWCRGTLAPTHLLEAVRVTDHRLGHGVVDLHHELHARHRRDGLHEGADVLRDAVRGHGQPLELEAAAGCLSMIEDITDHRPAGQKQWRQAWTTVMRAATPS